RLPTAERYSRRNCLWRHRGNPAKSKKELRRPHMTLSGHLSEQPCKGSVGLCAAEFDYLGPLLSFFSHKLSEIGRRARKQGCSQFRKPCLRRRIGEDRIDHLIELIDDLGRRLLWHADAVPSARLVARHEFIYGREIRQHFRACCACHRQSS